MFDNNFLSTTDYPNLSYLKEGHMRVFFKEHKTLTGSLQKLVLKAIKKSGYTYEVVEDKK